MGGVVHDRIGCPVVVVVAWGVVGGAGVCGGKQEVCPGLSIDLVDWQFRGPVQEPSCEHEVIQVG